jgi:hypothetical protein
MPNPSIGVCNVFVSVFGTGSGMRTAVLIAGRGVLWVRRGAGVNLWAEDRCPMNGGPTVTNTMLGGITSWERGRDRRIILHHDMSRLGVLSWDRGRDQLMCRRHPVLVVALTPGVVTEPEEIYLVLGR